MIGKISCVIENQEMVETASVKKKTTTKSTESTTEFSSEDSRYVSQEILIDFKHDGSGAITKNKSNLDGSAECQFDKVARTTLIDEKLMDKTYKESLSHPSKEVSDVESIDVKVKDEKIHACDQCSKTFPQKISTDNTLEKTLWRETISVRRMFQNFRSFGKSENTFGNAQG